MPRRPFTETVTDCIGQSSSMRRPPERAQTVLGLEDINRLEADGRLR